MSHGVLDCFQRTCCSGYCSSSDLHPHPPTRVGRGNREIISSGGIVQTQEEESGQRHQLETQTRAARNLIFADNHYPHTPCNAQFSFTMYVSFWYLNVHSWVGTSFVTFVTSSKEDCVAHVQEFTQLASKKFLKLLEHWPTICPQAMAPFWVSDPVREEFPPASK